MPRGAGRRNTVVPGGVGVGEGQVLTEEHARLVSRLLPVSTAEPPSPTRPNPSEQIVFRPRFVTSMQPLIATEHSLALGELAREADVVELRRTKNGRRSGTQPS